MDNATRKMLLQRHKASGFPGSIIDVYKAYDQGVDLIGQYQQQQMQQQQQPQVAQTPQERQEGLRPAHQAGDTNQSMVFPNTEPNASFNTVGMKAPIDIKQYDDTGNLVASYDKVPPGITDLKMSSQGGTVLETPAQMKSGGIRKFQSGEVLQSDNTRVNTPKPQTTPTLNPPRFEPKSQGTITQAPYDSSDFWRAVKDHNLRDDSTFENTVEAFESTGVSSWDDAYRAYNSMQNRGAMLPNADEALDMFGAIPFLGKAKFAFNLAKKAQKPLAYYGMQFYNNFGRHVINNINRADALEDETGFLDQMKTGGIKKYQSAGLPTYADSTNVANFARAAQDFYNDPNNKYRLVSEYTPEEYTNLSWSDFVKYLHKKTDAFNHAHPSSWNVDIKRINNAFNTNITADAFIRDVSNPYQVSPPDVLNGNYNSFFNPNAPDPIFDSRIVPESVIYYKDGDDATDIPSYDPIMVTPWQDLTEDEKKERVDKGIRTGNTGGIPQQVLQGGIPQQVLQTTGIQNKNSYTGSNTGLFIDAPFEMPSLPPSQIPTEALEEKSLIPIMRAKSRGREPQTIYKQDPRVSTGQYPVGERIWDYDLNRWKTDMWDEDMIRSSRELALPRREKWRTIETPPGGFKNGGMRKAQNGLPPFSLEQQPIQAESTFRPNFVEQAFLNQMAAGPREERVLDIGPTISQGNFEVDENNKIIEDRPSYLEMAANPMATARAILNPAVEGLPSQVEFDQSINRGNPIGLAANDIVNPAAWANYGANALSDLGQGNFLSAGINALSAVPGLSLSGTTAATAGKQALNATVGQGIRNIAYNMVDPFEYTPRFLTPKQIIRNVLNPAGRPSFHQGLANAKSPVAVAGAARRLDALAIGLGKKPRYNTLRQIGDNTYEPINGPVNVKDILRTTEDALNSRLASTGELGERGSTIGIIDGTFKTMGGYHLVDEAVPNNPMLRRIIMNDTWDLHPFQAFGVERFANYYPVTKKIWNALPTRAQNYISNKFRDLEVFDALGGKPINIQSRWTAEMAPDWATSKNVGPLALTNDATGRSFNSYLLDNRLRKYEMLSLFDKPNYKNGGVRKAQNGLPPLTLGQTSPDWRATGPGLRIDGQTYQNSQLTGATRVPLNPETGDQLPIMLPTAEIVGNGGVAAGTGIGLLGDDMQLPPKTYNRYGGVKKYQEGGENDKNSPKEISWYTTPNFQNWGLLEYPSTTTFNSAFKDARQRGEEEFVWNSNRYHTELAPEEASNAYNQSKDFINKYIENAPFTWEPGYYETSELSNRHSIEDLVELERNPELRQTLKDSIIQSEENLYREQLRQNLEQPFYFSLTSENSPTADAHGFVNWRGKQHLDEPQIFISYDPNNPRVHSTSVHELAHKTLHNPEGTYVRIPTDLIPETKDRKWPAYLANNSNYYFNPKEIEARAVSALYYLDQQGVDVFNEKVTEEDLFTLQSNKESNLPNDVYQLLDIYQYDTEKLIRLLNRERDFKSWRPTNLNPRKNDGSW